MRSQSIVWRYGLRAAAVFAVALGVAVAWALAQRPPVERSATALAPQADPEPVREAEYASAAVAAKQAPDSAERAVEAGSLAGGLGRFDVALDWFRRASALKPDLLPAIVGQGQMQMELGHPGRAAEAYERAVRLNGAEPALRLELARAYTYLRDFGPALREATEAARLDPSNAEACRALSNIYAELLDAEKALRQADRACELAPSDAENWANKGHLLLKNQRFSEAEAAFRQALKRDPSHTSSNVYLARTLVEGRKTRAADDEAFVLLARARTADPFNAEALLLQGEIRTRAGDLPGAVSLLRQSREADPRNQETLLALGQALVRSGKGEEGVRIVAEGQRLGPRGVGFSGLENQARKDLDPALVTRLAELYVKQDLPDSAELILKRAIQRHPDNTELREKLDKIRASNGAPAGAG